MLSPMVPEDRLHCCVCGRDFQYYMGPTMSPFCSQHLEVAYNMDQPNPLALHHQAQKEAENHLAEAKDARATVHDFIVESKEDEVLAAEVLQDVKERAKRINDARLSATKPLRQSIDVIQGWFKPALDALAEVERDLKQKILNYRQQSEQERVAALAAIQSSTTVQQAQTAIVRAQEAAKAAEPTRGVTISKVWDWELENIEDVPTEYLSVDVAKVRADVQAGVRRIPGIRIFQKEVVSSRRV